MTTFVLSAALSAAAALTVFEAFDPLARLVASAGIALAPLAATWALDVGLLVAHRRYRAVFAMQL